MTISFFVAGEPRPQPRPRAFVRRTKGGKTVAGVYSEEGRVAIWRADVRAAAREHFPTPLEGPVELRLIIHQRPPAGWSKRRMRLLEQAGCLPDIRKNGDPDNYLKAVADALNGIAYHDDSQAWSQWAKKIYSARSGAQIEIKKTGEEKP